MARPAGFEPTLGFEGRVKSHRITADLGKTGSAFFLCGRSKPVAASCQGKSCTKLAHSSGRPA